MFLQGVGGVHGGRIGGTVNKSAEEAAAGAVHHEPQADSSQPSNQRTS
jgi:hypothetical protein